MSRPPVTTRDHVYDAAMRAMRAQEAAEHMVDEAEDRRARVYRWSQDAEWRAEERKWLDEMQALRDMLIEHADALRALHERLPRNAGDSR